MRTRFIPASTADPTKSNCSGGVHYANSANAIGSTGAIWPRVNGSNYCCRLGGRYTQWSDHSHSVKALWGARCGKSARWVLSGGTGTRSYASLGEGTGSKGSDNSEAPQRATASRLVPTHQAGQKLDIALIAADVGFADARFLRRCAKLRPAFGQIILRICFVSRAGLDRGDCCYDFFATVLGDVERRWSVGGPSSINRKSRDYGS
jgi:hypothetical protein